MFCIGFFTLPVIIWIILIVHALILKSTKYMKVGAVVVMFTPAYYMFIWSIYGYELKNNTENDCGLTIESVGWNSMMTINLVIGLYIGGIFIISSIIVVVILNCKQLKDAFTNHMAN